MIHLNSTEPSNYTVTTYDFRGKVVTECTTKKEAWDAIGAASFGALYIVTSKKDLDVSEFTPF